MSFKMTHQKYLNVVSVYHKNMYFRFNSIRLKSQHLKITRLNFENSKFELYIQ